MQSLPNFLKQLNVLEIFQILDCGNYSEGLGALRVLQGLRIWGCTTMTELSRSCLYAVDENSLNLDWLYDFEQWDAEMQRNCEWRTQMIVDSYAMPGLFRLDWKFSNVFTSCHVVW